MKLTGNEIRVLAWLSRNGKQISEVERRSERDFDLSVRGEGWSGWLPLAGIGAINWGNLGSETDFGSLDAGWSAIRDSADETIWNMFWKHVLPVVDRQYFGS